MFDSLWEIIQKKEGLLEEAHKKSLAMLSIVKNQYTLVMQALRDETNSDISNRIWSSDKQINEKQMEVREMVYEHLAISSARDLLTGLQLANVVVDLERAGDYTKNISELVEMFPRQLKFGKREEEFNRLHLLILEIFEMTYTSYEKRDSEQSRQVIDKYDSLSKSCDAMIKETITAGGDNESVKKDDLALVLMLRYMKRVGAHLKNIASAVANPFPRFGFRAGS